MTAVLMPPIAKAGSSVVPMTRMSPTRGLASELAGIREKLRTIPYQRSGTVSAVFPEAGVIDLDVPAVNPTDGSATTAPMKSVRVIGAFPAIGDLVLYTDTGNGRITYQGVLHQGTGDGGTPGTTGFGDIWYAEQHGVVSNDGTDQAATLNAAILAASTAGVGWLYLPPGVINIASPVKLQSGVIVVGAGKLSSYINLLPNSDCNIVECADGARHGGLRNVYLSGDRYSQTPGTFNHGIYTPADTVFDPAFSFVDVEINACTGHGTNGVPEDNAFTFAGHFFSNVYVHDCGGYGFVPRWDTTFANCNAFGCGLSGFYMANPSNSITGTKSYNNGRAPLWNGTAVAYNALTTYHIADGVKDGAGNVWVATDTIAPGGGLPPAGGWKWTKLVWGPWEGGHAIWNGFVYTGNGHYYVLLTSTVTGAFSSTGGIVDTNFVQASGVGSSIAGQSMHLDPLPYGYGFHLRGITAGAPSDGGGKECAVAAVDAQQNSGGGYYLQNCVGSVLQGVVQQANCNPWDGFNRLAQLETADVGVDPETYLVLGTDAGTPLFLNAFTSELVTLFVGSDNQDVVLPHVDTGITVGHKYRFTNKSSGTITVRSVGTGGLTGAVVATVNPFSSRVVSCVATTSGDTTATPWLPQYSITPSSAIVLDGSAGVIIEVSTTHLNAGSDRSGHLLDGSTDAPLTAAAAPVCYVMNHATRSNIFIAGDTSGIEPTSSTISDNNVVIYNGQLLGGSGAAVGEYGVFNVKNFGAVGDGIADDAPKIQDAIDACAAAGGRVVYAPPGVYWLGSGLTMSTAGVTFQGASQASTIFRVPKNAAYSAFTLSTVTEGGAEDFSVYMGGPPDSLSSGASGANTTPGIYVTGGLFTRLSRITVYGFQTGVKHYQTTDIRLEEVFVQGGAQTATLYGFLFDGSVGQNASVYLLHCNVAFHNATYTGTSYGYHHSGVFPADFYLHFCEAGGCTYGLFFDGTAAPTAVQPYLCADIHIVGLVADQCLNGIWIQNTIQTNGGMINIDNFWFSTMFASFGGDGTGSGVVVNNSSGVRIRGGQLYSSYDGTAGSGNYAVVIDGSSDCSVNGVTCEGGWTQNIFLSASSLCSVLGNTIVGTIPTAGGVNPSAILVDGGGQHTITSNTMRGLVGHATLWAGVQLLGASSECVVGFNVIDTVTITNPVLISNDTIAANLRQNSGADFLDYYNVKDYGAKGDGSTADDVAINAAIAQATAAGGGTVYVPVGQYELSASISIGSCSGVHLRGASQQSTVLHVAHNATFAPIAVTGSGSYNKISDFTILMGSDTSHDDGTAASGSNTTPGISVTNTLGMFLAEHLFLHIDHVTIYNFQTGIYASGSNNLRINYVFIGSLANTSTVYGVYLHSVSDLTENSSCHIFKCNSGGFEHAVTGIGYYIAGTTRLHDLSISHCESAGVGGSNGVGHNHIGLMIDGTGSVQVYDADDIHVIQFLADGMNTAGIHLKALNGGTGTNENGMINIDGFWFGAGTQNAVGLIIEDSMGVAIRGAQLLGFPGNAGTSQGIGVTNGTDCSIMQCDINGFSAGINFSTGSFCTVIGNNIYNTINGGTYGIALNTTNNTLIGYNTIRQGSSVTLTNGIYVDSGSVSCRIGMNTVQGTVTNTLVIVAGATDIIARDNVNCADHGATLLGGFATSSIADALGQTLFSLTGTSGAANSDRLIISDALGHTIAVFKQGTTAATANYLSIKPGAAGVSPAISAIPVSGLGNADIVLNPFGVGHVYEGSNRLLNVTDLTNPTIIGANFTGAVTMTSTAAFGSTGQLSISAAGVITSAGAQTIVPTAVSNKNQLIVQGSGSSGAQYVTVNTIIPGSGVLFGSIDFQAYRAASTPYGSVNIEAQTTEPWSSTAAGSTLVMQVTPNTTVIPTTTLTLVSAAAAGNYYEISSVGSGASPTIKALGAATDIDVKLVPKGAGNVYQNTSRLLNTGDLVGPHFTGTTLAVGLTTSGAFASTSTAAFGSTGQFTISAAGVLGATSISGALTATSTAAFGSAGQLTISAAGVLGGTGTYFSSLKDSSGNVGISIGNDAGTVDTDRIVLSDKFGHTIVAFPQGTVATVNYLSFKAGASGASPSVTALGTNGDIDIILTPKGVGNVYQAGTRLLNTGDLVNLALTGTPTAPTATIGTATTQIATTAFVNRFAAGLMSTAAAITSTVTLGTTDAVVTGLTKTITLVSGRTQLVMVMLNLTSTVAGDVITVYLGLGAGGAIHAATQHKVATAGQFEPVMLFAIPTGLSGSTTLTCRAFRSSGSGTCTAYADTSYVSRFAVLDIATV